MDVDQIPVIKPKALKRNSLILLVAPAGPIQESQLVKAQEKLSEMGFRTGFTKRIFEKKGYIAGDDTTRILDLHEAFENRDADAILCIRGGYGCSRIVDKIDYELIKKNPKVFIGYSDITVLLNAIFKITGLITFHGVVGTSTFSEYTKQNFLHILCNCLKDNIIFPEIKSNIRIINDGNANGQLTGGNLAVISALIGSPYEPDFNGKIVFLEDIDEAPYRIDRMLTHLLLANKLQKASAIILGDLKGCDFDNKKITKENSLSLNDVIYDRLSGLGIPVIMGFSFGHIKNQALFPIGINAFFDTENPVIKLLEPVVT